MTIRAQYAWDGPSGPTVRPRALEAGSVQTAPSALDQYDAPEHIWAAALWWGESYSDESVAVEVSVRRHITNAVCAAV